jgi:hypothetical protein
MKNLLVHIKFDITCQRFIKVFYKWMNTTMQIQYMGPLFSATNVLDVYISHHQVDIRSQKE